MAMDPEPRSGLIGAIRRELLGMDRVDLALRVTLLDLLLRPIGNWAIRPAILLIAGLGLLCPGVLKSRWTWLLLTGLTGWRAIADWPLADNHAYLLSYWCLAIFLSLLIRDRGASLAINGRLLIGLVFLLATLWKVVLSPDYMDGRFFRVTMLTDPRFADVALLVGDMSGETLEDNRAYLEEPGYGGVRELSEPRRLALFAHVSTWWTALVEAALVVCFLWPRKGWLTRQRHAVLMIFCATTYAVATVAGFGWLLIAMGIAQCEPERTRVRGLYLATFGLILLYKEVPWAFLLLE
jgi:hypothetical protein